MSIRARGPVAVAIAAVLAAGAWFAMDTAGPAPAEVVVPESPQARAGFADAAQLAEALPTIDPAAQYPKYVRADYGPRWADIDGNSCDQRNDVLQRDLVDVVLDVDGCTVLTGVLEDDPYTGRDIVFQHDKVAEEGNPGSQGVQIEHIVSLEAVHRGGGWRWSPDRKMAFANDLANIIAVDGPSNNAKQEAGPADWLVPDNPEYRCTYAARYTQILHDWELAVDVDDRDQLVHTLTDCSDQPASVS